MFYVFWSWFNAKNNGRSTLKNNVVPDVNETNSVEQSQQL
jgi:hypothetical protein